MKMIKLIGLAAAFMLTGCANMEAMMNAKSDPVFLLRECKAAYASDDQIESCFISKMERRDVDRVSTTNADVQGCNQRSAGRESTRRKEASRRIAQTERRVYTT